MCAGKLGNLFWEFFGKWWNVLEIMYVVLEKEKTISAMFETQLPLDDQCSILSCKPEEKLKFEF